MLGAKHPSTLTYMGNVALFLREQGRDDEALALLEECVQLQKQELGLGHPFTMSSLAALNRWKIRKPRS